MTMLNAQEMFQHEVGDIYADGKTTFRLLANLRVWAYTRIEPQAPAHLLVHRSGELLTRLVDRSLVLAEPQAGEGRYRLLEPIRQYAEEHLTALGESEGVRDRHAAHYMELAEHAAAELWDCHVTGPFGSAAQLAWQARLEQEHDNLRTGLAWVEQQGTPESLARWCAALWGSRHLPREAG